MKLASLLLTLCSFFVPTVLHAEVQDETASMILDPSESLEIGLTNFKFIPSSCQLADKARCLEELQHIEWIQHVLHFFSKKKGDSIIFTTEHFEEALTAIRQLAITGEDLKNLKNNPNHCLEKVMPVLKLMAKHANFSLDEAIIHEFCNVTTASYSLLSTLQVLSGAVKDYSGHLLTVAILSGMVIAVFEYQKILDPRKVKM